MDIEKQFIDTFIAPNKQEQVYKILTNPKRRNVYFGKSIHSCDFIPSMCIEIPDDSQTTEGIEKILKSYGSRAKCQTISEAPELDRKQFELDDILKRIIGKGIATCLICIPGELGYFEGNDMEDRLILRKK